MKLYSVCSSYVWLTIRDKCGIQGGPVSKIWSGIKGCEHSVKLTAKFRCDRLGQQELWDYLGAGMHIWMMICLCGRNARSRSNAQLGILNSEVLKTNFPLIHKKCIDTHEHGVCYTSLDPCWFTFKFARATDHSVNHTASFLAQLVTDHLQCQFTMPYSEQYNLDS